MISIKSFAKMCLLLTMFHCGTSIDLDTNIILEEITNLANRGLGVQAMQEYFENLIFDKIPIDGSRVVERLQIALNFKFQSLVAALRDLKEAVEDSLDQPEATFDHCCDVSSGLEFNSLFRTELDLNRACIRVGKYADETPRQLSKSVVDVMKRNYETTPTLKWQYFGSEQGIFTLYPATSVSSCTEYDHRYRPWYVEAATPEPKSLVIVIDKSGSMNERYGGKTLMQVAIDAAITVLDTTNPGDKIGVVAFSDEAQTLSGSPRDDEDDYLNCFSDQLAQATPINIDYLRDFISSLQYGGGTNYIKALETAFDLLHASVDSEDDMERDQVILFLTDGEPEEDSQEIMEVVRTRNEEMQNRVVILTIGLGNADGLSFLTDLANQDFTKFGLEGANVTIGEIKRGDYTQVTDYGFLRNAMARYYNFFSRSATTRDEPIFSVPYQDGLGLGLMTTALMPVKHGGELRGVVCIDITLDDLLGDISYFKEGERTYAFLYEVNSKATGRTLLHPLLPAPVNIEDDPVYVHVTTLERDEKFVEFVFHNSSRQDSGEATFTSKRTLPRGNSVKEGVITTSVVSTYYWRQVSGSPYIVCFVKPEDDYQLSLGQLPRSGEDFLYHRIDLVQPPSSCRLFNRHATTAQSTVKFAPNAFSDPLDYLESEETADIVQSYADYIDDESGTIPNRYFKDGIKAMSLATARVDEIWPNVDTGYDDYTLFRYIGTENGVFREFPGVRMNKLYDPTTRPWYARSKVNQGMLTLSAPYTAASGVGHVITLSKTIVHRTVSTQVSSTSDDVIAVMGMDFTLAYFYNLLAQNYQECNEARYTCFVMDISGYLVVHKDFLNSDEDFDIEEVHITQIEPSIAKDLMMEGLLTKETCLNFQKIKDQKYYTAQSSAWSNSVNKMTNDDVCKRYQLSHIRDTNAFLGIIDISDRSAHCRDSVICPCYYRNCYTTDIDACECPCLSQADYDYCNDKFTFTSDDDPPCTPESPSLSPIIEEPDAYEGLKSCHVTDCRGKVSSSDCRAFISCTWNDDDQCVNAYPSSVTKSDSKSTVAIVASTVVIVVLLIVLASVLIVKARTGLFSNRHKHAETTGKFNASNSGSVNLAYTDAHGIPSAPMQSDLIAGGMPSAPINEAGGMPSAPINEAGGMPSAPINEAGGMPSAPMESEPIYHEPDEVSHAYQV
ncbi:VWFA and cache domain-containing protein 1-like isoform X2 [Ptychodera flava]|uniref:VWFA and cache domain-containing protein 1-like isoform X2 n=1 Tax=Ptychodera flava TaxID=63121 RepID=UPI003969E18C